MNWNAKVFPAPFSKKLATSVLRTLQTPKGDEGGEHQNDGVFVPDVFAAMQIGGKRSVVAVKHRRKKPPTAVPEAESGKRIFSNTAVNLRCFFMSNACDGLPLSPMRFSK